MVDELRRHDVSLAIVTAPELGCSAEDDLTFNILAASADFEREMIGARIADARARLKPKGRRVAGAVPYGYDADPRTKQLTDNADKTKTVSWMLEVAASGMRPTAIAESPTAVGGVRKLWWPDEQRSSAEAIYGRHARWWQPSAIRSTSAT